MEGVRDRGAGQSEGTFRREPIRRPRPARPLRARAVADPRAVRRISGRPFERWLAEKAAGGVELTDDQRAWLALMREHIATSLSIERGDFELAPFSQRGGLGRAAQLFADLPALLDELNEALAA